MADDDLRMAIGELRGTVGEHSKFVERFGRETGKVFELEAVIKELRRDVDDLQKAREIAEQRRVEVRRWQVNTLIAVGSLVCVIVFGVLTLTGGGP